MTTGIQKTKDYSIFKNITGNREMNPHHLAKLTLSIVKDNMLAVNPIIVNEKMEIIDGQHRLEVARANNLEVYYMVLPNASLDQVMEFNANIKPWMARNYVDSYASQGKKDYQWFLELMTEYGLSVQTASILIFGNEGGGTVGVIKSGKMKLSEEQKTRAKARADLLYAVKPYLLHTGGVPVSFTRALLKLYDEGKGDKFVKILQDKGRSFKPETTLHLAQEQVQRIMM